MKLAYWMTAARPVGHGMIAIPLLWGQAVALLYSQQFAWQWFAIIHVFGMLCQVFILYLNDYADEAIDRQNETYWLSGGSRVIPDGYLSGQQLFMGALVALLLLLLLSGLGYALGRVWMPIWVAAALVLGWTYSLRPIRSSYSGFGELHQALSCGAFLPLMAFYLQAGDLAGFPWLCLLPLCLIFFAGNMITALPDVVSDRLGEKRSYPVRLGERRARRDALLFLMLAYVMSFVFALAYLGLLPALVTAGPAIALLLYVYHSGLVEGADVSNQRLCRRYIFLATMSQVWVMVLWSVFLFWHGLENARVATGI